jgi:hypothetical protein
MADNMTSEQRPGSPQGDIGVGALATSNEIQIIPSAAQDTSVTKRHLPAPIAEITAEADLSARYASLVNLISVYKTDIGIDPVVIDEQSREIPRLENIKKSRREELLRKLSVEKQRLAIQAFPRYLAVWRETDPENEGIILSFERMFEEAGNEGTEAQAAVVDETRTQLSTILSVKGTYYTEMLTTLLIDSGFSPDQAEEQVLTKAPPVGDAVSIPEKAQNLRNLKTAAIDYLVNDSMETTIEAWDALYPGFGEEAEMQVLSARGHDRYRLAKDLYKKVHTELERRRVEYQERVYQFLKAQGKSSNEAHFEAREIDFSLRNLPRAEQARIMRMGEIPQIEARSAIDPTQQVVLDLYLGVADKFAKLGNEDLARRLRKGLSDPDTRESTYQEIEEIIRQNRGEL